MNNTGLRPKGGDTPPMGKGSTGSRSESKAGGGAVGGLGEKPVQRLIQELL